MGFLQFSRFSGIFIRNCYEYTRCRKKPKGSERVLKDITKVFQFNSWDNVEWGADQEQAALSAVEKNSDVIFSTEQLDRFETESATNWNNFYGIHQNKFFKNRNWLFTEFPELAPHLCDGFPLKISVSNSKSSGRDGDEVAPQLDAGVSGHRNDTSNSRLHAAEDAIHSGDADVSASHATINGVAAVNQDSVAHGLFPGSDASYRVLEVGCGVGNTIFPLLATNDNPGLFVYGGDFSETAIDIIKQHEDYDIKRCNVFVLDVTSDEWTVPFPPNSLDVITCIYVLSAIHPDKHLSVCQRLAHFLRPGGVLLLRDYGRYDLAQLRFKQGKCLASNYYVRGDGTKCYFFTQEEIRQCLQGAGLEERHNIVDRRLQVNRGKQLTMYRVWVQAKFAKPNKT